jgi:hypothetical protein
MDSGTGEAACQEMNWALHQLERNKSDTRATTPHGFLIPSLHTRDFHSNKKEFWADCSIRW